MRSETKVILALLLLLLGLEAAARLMETRLSKDVQHLRSLPEQAQKLRGTTHDRARILLLGNSLARCGVHIPTLQAGIQQAMEAEPTIAVMHPDGSKIEEWAYGYNRFFRDTASEPDLILLITGRQHLTDKIKSIDDLGAFYVGTNDLPAFVANHLHKLEDTGWFFASRYSALMAHRARVEPLVFYKFVPGYEQTAQEINRGIQAPAVTPAATCNTFSQFASDLAKRKVKLVVVSAPLPEPFSLPPEVLKAAALSKAFVHEAGAKMRLPPERFPDQYHLDEIGADIFTKDLLPSVIEALKTRTADH
ncbi:MAG: hypothetical protein JNJ83_05895 [Verrucomicrobiaceae bacterium]|nr:hypothetical protein [Verrucomicrobiaceae bacterium]